MALPGITSRASGKTYEVVGRKAIFFDRDGVLTIPVIRDGRAFAPVNAEEFAVYQVAAEAVQRAQAAGFLCILVTNQPDVAIGKTTKEFVESMHLRLKTELRLDDIEVSYDSSDSNAYRRKPNPGMLTESAQKWDIELRDSYLIGDTWRDIEAAHAAGCRAVYIDRLYENEIKTNPQHIDYVAKDVLDGVSWCIAQLERS